MGKKLGKSVFTTGIAATTVLSGMFNHKASAEEVKQNENAETNSTEVVEKPITVDELKQITAQKGQVVKDVHYQEQKVIDAQTEVKAAGQELEEKKSEVEVSELHSQESPADGSKETFAAADGVFVALGTAGSAEMARQMGAALTEKGNIKVNEKMESTIPGLFAAGDCTGGLLQVAKAVYDGAQAGLSANQYVRNKEKSVRK